MDKQIDSSFHRTMPISKFSQKPDFKAVFDSLPGVYLLLNPDLTIAAASNDRLKATNTTREQIMGRGIFEVFPDNPDDPQANGVRNLKASLEHVLKTKQSHRMAIQRYDIPKSGTNNREFEERYWSPYNSPVLNDEGKLIFIIHHVEDVTEKVKAMDEAKRLEESEFRFRQIANALPQPVWTAQPDGYIDWYSDKYEEYTGVCLRSNYSDNENPLHPDDILKTQQQWEYSVSTGKPLNVEQRLRHKDGQYRWHVSKAEPIRDESGRILKWVGSTTDIHDQKMFAHGLEQERDLRERFVSTLSHDLRTPLTAAKMTAQLLAKKADDAETVKTLALKVVANIDRSDGMIRDLLDVNRVQAGEKLPLETTECEMNKIIKETIDDLGTVHGDRFLVNMPNHSIHGFWASSGLKRILENLCSNAVKYGAKDRKVTVTLSQSGSQVVLSVHNWGNSISSEDQKSLFEQYWRTDSAQKSPEKGWGLGLTLVKGITEAHKGSVTVKSSADKGTFFIVNLPLDSRS